jgi:hypothetical protein
LRKSRPGGNKRVEGLPEVAVVHRLRDGLIPLRNAALSELVGFREGVDDTPGIFSADRVAFLDRDVPLAHPPGTMATVGEGLPEFIQADTTVLVGTQTGELRIE